MMMRTGTSATPPHRSRHLARWAALLLGLAVQTSPAAEGPPPGSTPILLPGRGAPDADGSTIYFEWARDLWRVPSEGGRAMRVTSHPAVDQAVHPVAEGGSLVFTSFRHGARQVFSLSSAGGAPVQHSFHSEGVVLEDVSPCGGRAIVRVLRDHGDFAPFRLLEIDLREARAERPLFDEKGHSAKLSPDGARLLFCRDGESVHRRGYRGERAASIWLHEREDGSFRQLVKEDAAARDPLWLPDGSGFYYISERDGTFNFWKRGLEEDARDEQLTFFEGDGVLHPAISADGSTLVFRRGFQLWTWRPAEGSIPRPLDLWHREDLPGRSEELMQIRGSEDVDFSPSGLEIVFAAEGRVWAMDTVLREPRALTPPEIHATRPRFGDEGRAVYFLADDGLNRSLRKIERQNPLVYWWQSSGTEERRVSPPGEEIREFELSPDARRIAWVAGRGRLVVADAADPDSAATRFDGWDCAEIEWSPAGEWIAFSSLDDDFTRNVFVVSTDPSEEARNISQHPTNDSSPAWSPDGRKLAFLSTRAGGRNRAVFVHLREDDHLRNPRAIRTEEAEAAMRRDPLYQADPPTAPEPEPEPEPDEPPSTAPEPDDARDDSTAPADEASERGDAAAGDAKEEAAPAERDERIDFEGIADRIRLLDTRGQTPYRLIWSHDSRSLLFQSTTTSDNQLYRVGTGDGDRPSNVVAQRGQPLRMESDGTLLWVVDRAPARLRGERVTRYPISVDLLRERREHLRQGFRLLWRTLRDEFYDESMNQLDWDAVGERYEEIAIQAPDSETYREAIQMMLGELNASHLGFNASAWPPAWRDETSTFRQTRHPGLRFELSEDARWQVAAVLESGPAALTEPRIEPGDLLLAVDGVEVPPDSPLEGYLNGRRDDPLTLTIRHADGGEHAHRILPITWGQARSLARAELLREKRREVHERSDGRLGYIHLASMMNPDLEEFQRLLFSAGHGREGLVIDVRDNTGGRIADELLQILLPPRHAFTVARGGGAGYPQYRTPMPAWDRPILVICNAATFSNGEVFTHAVKTLGRGQVVGVPTAGGVISTINRPLLDLGTMRVPFRGWFLPDSGEDFELHGATPQHHVEAHPADLVRGIDRQLETAVEVLLEECDEVRARPAAQPRYRNR